jgi:hypothetical protein
MKNTVNSLWIGDRLTKMEFACIKSWLNLGYKYQLYTYQKIENTPKGTTILNAENILSKNKIFKYNCTIKIILSKLVLK